MTTLAFSKKNRENAYTSGIIALTSSRFRRNSGKLENKLNYVNSINKLITLYIKIYIVL